MSYFHNDVFRTRAAVTTGMSSLGCEVICGFKPGVVSVYNATNGASLNWDSSMRNARRGAVATVSGTPSDNYFGVVIAGVTVEVAGNTSASQTATDLAAALNASTDAAFSHITWTGSSGTLIAASDDLTGDDYLEGAKMVIRGSGTGTITAFGGFSALKTVVGATSAADAMKTTTVTGALTVKNDANGAGFVLTGGLADIVDTATEVLHISVQPENRAHPVVQAAT